RRVGDIDEPPELACPRVGIKLSSRVSRCPGRCRVDRDLLKTLLDGRIKTHAVADRLKRRDVRMKCVFPRSIIRPEVLVERIWLPPLRGVLCGPRYAVVVRGLRTRVG